MAALIHYSDCAVNNGPAYPAGPCDCGMLEPKPHFLEVEREIIRDQILFPKLRAFGGCDGARNARQFDCERGNCACAQLADTLMHDIAFWSPGGGADNS